MSSAGRNTGAGERDKQNLIKLKTEKDNRHSRLWRPGPRTAGNQGVAGQTESEQRRGARAERSAPPEAEAPP